MRIARRNVVLAASLAALIAVDLGLRATRPAAREVLRLFPELTGAVAARIVIEGPAGRVELERALLPGAEGSELGPWTVVDALGYPADARRVAELVDRLRSLRTLDVVAEHAERHADFGVDPGSHRIVVLASEREGGSRLADLVLGLPTAVGAEPLPHLRRADGELVVRAADFPLPEARAQAWLAPRWLELEPAWVRSIAVRGAGAEPFTALRKGLDRWEGAAGERVRAADASALLALLAELAPRAVLARGEEDDDPRPPELELELVLEGGAGVVLSFGAQGPGGTRRALRNDAPWVVAIAEAAYHSLLDLARALSAG